MRTYIMSVIGAALLSAAASVLTPEKWRKYVNIAAGLIIICVVVSPIGRVSVSELLPSFEESGEEITRSGEELREQLIKEELEKRINNDIEERLKTEFNIEARAECSVGVNGSGEISGVSAIRVYGADLTDAAEKRLCEVYGVEEIENK